MQQVVQADLASLVLPRRPLYRIAKRLLDIAIVLRTIPAAHSTRNAR
jgi:hypothetical protein